MSKLFEVAYLLMTVSLLVLLRDCCFTAEMSGVTDCFGFLADVRLDTGGSFCTRLKTFLTPVAGSSGCLGPYYLRQLREYFDLLCVDDVSKQWRSFREVGSKQLDGLAYVPDAELTLRFSFISRVISSIKVPDLYSHTEMTKGDQDDLEEHQVSCVLDFEVGRPLQVFEGDRGNQHHVRET